MNFLAKSYVVRPLTEYFWNTKQTEIFLNSYQQKHAFAELKDFEEKLYFESLIYPKSIHQPEMEEQKEHSKSSYFQYYPIKNNVSPPLKENTIPSTKNWVGSTSDFVNFYKFPKNIEFKNPMFLENKTINSNTLLTIHQQGNIVSINHSLRPISSILKKQKNEKIFMEKNRIYPSSLEYVQSPNGLRTSETKNKKFYVHPIIGSFESNMDEKNLLQKLSLSNVTQSSVEDLFSFNKSSPSFFPVKNESRKEQEESFRQEKNDDFLRQSKDSNFETSNPSRELDYTQKTDGFHINSPSSKSSFLVYQTIEADKNIQQRYQEKTIELAQRYNDQSVEAITNFFGDIVSLVTLFYLLYVLEIQINITQSFLLEVFFGLDDSKKSLLILLVTDLLVGYHSSNLWELFFELFFNHYGLPESQTGIFLLVATLPVLLDVLFKYLIFRHLNRSSPATVATYHAIIE